MSTPNAAIKRQHDFTDPLSKPIMESTNPDLYDTRLPRMYPVHRHIYIYSVARRDFPKKHVYFKGKLTGCHKGERYVLCTTIPDPPQQLSVDPERGGHRVEVEPRDEAGWRVAIDILNPNNPSTNPYFRPSAEQAAYYSIGQSVDLMRYGLFPSLHNPPLEEEIVRAEQERDKSYQDLIDEAFQEQSSNPQGFRVWLKNHPEITEAMQATGTVADWHKAPESKMSCPNCGDVIKAGIAFHKSSAGVLCIIDPVRAAKAGVGVEDAPKKRNGIAAAAQEYTGR
jgi:hypothetical protein